MTARQTRLDWRVPGLAAVFVAIASLLLAGCSAPLLSSPVLPTVSPAFTAAAAPASATPDSASAKHPVTANTAPGVAALPLMVAVQVSPSAWYVEGLSAAGSPANQNFISNAGFIISPAGVVVIDALGTPALAERLVELIRQKTPLPITHVIVTHYHADHVYGLQVFSKLGASIWAHRAANEYLHSDNARLRLIASRSELAPWVNDETELTPATRWLDGPAELNLGGLRILIQPLGPSHTPEDLAVYLPDEKLLFAGDLVFRNRIPFVGQANSRRWIAALDELLALKPGVIVPGHGAVSRQGAQDMQLTRDYLVYLRKAMGEAAKNLEPFEQAYALANWERFEQVPMFRFINRMNAYNTYLLMEREGD